MVVIDVLIYHRKDSHIDLRAKHLFSLLSTEYKINYYYKEKKSILENFTCYLKKLNNILNDQPDIAYAMDFGPGTAIVFLILRLLRPSLKIIIDTGDLAYELKKIAGRSFLEQQIFRLAEWYLLKISDIKIVRGSYHKEMLEKQGFKNIYFLPDGVDTNVFKSMPEPGFRQKMGLDNVFTIGLVSTLSWEKKIKYCHGWDLIEVLKILKDKPIKGILIGDGDALPYLKNLANIYGVANKILFLGYIPHFKLAKYLNLFDIALLTQINHITAETRTSGKLPLYLASGCYILATEVGEAKNFLPKEMLLPYHGVKDINYPFRLAEKIREILNNRNLLEIRSECPKIAQKYFNYKVLSMKLRNIIMDELSK